MSYMGAGDNDCMVSDKSAQWDKFRRTLIGTSDGVNHFNEINHFFGLTPGFDVIGFYVGVVRELKKMGY